MSRCDRCGADSDVTFALAIGPDTFTVDSFECALEAHDAIMAGKFQVSGPRVVPARATKPRQHARPAFQRLPKETGLHVRP